MDIRYSTGKEPFKRMTTEEIRKEFAEHFCKERCYGGVQPH